MIHRTSFLSRCWKIVLVQSCDKSTSSQSVFDFHRRPTIFEVAIVYLVHISGKICLFSTKTSATAGRRTSLPARPSRWIKTANVKRLGIFHSNMRVMSGISRFITAHSAQTEVLVLPLRKSSRNLGLVDGSK